MIINATPAGNGVRAMPTPKITVEQVVADLQRAVEEKGADYIYPNLDAGSEWRFADGSCLYRNAKTGEPACIVGHVLAYHGLLAELASEGAAADTLEVVGDNFTATAAVALRAVQKAQDEGATWGEALRVLDRLINPAAVK